MKKYFKTITLVFCVIIGFFEVKAQNQNDIYAGFIFHFGKYVQWPANMQSGDFVVGVVGNGAIKTKLDNLASTKNLNGRKIVVKKVKAATDLSGCNLVFIPNDESSMISVLKSAAKTNKVLLVSEGDGNLSKGSVFNFIEKDGKVRFEFDQAAADANGLKVSADLIKLAIVK